ncbi:hypothetical protein V6N13_005540 [Hibiscus sabdariffa]
MFLPHQSLVNPVSYTPSHSVSTVPTSPLAPFASSFSSANVVLPSISCGAPLAGPSASKDVVWSKIITRDILSTQSDSTFPLVIVSPEGLNEVGNPVADEPRVDTGLGLTEVTAPETDGSCGATRSTSTEQRFFYGLALESQEVHADPWLCSGSVLGSIRELRDDPESVASADPVCEVDPHGLGSVPTSSGHDSLREELGEASLHNDVQLDLGFSSVLARTDSVAPSEVHGSRSSEIDASSSTANLHPMNGCLVVVSFDCAGADYSQCCCFSKLEVSR